MPESTLNLTFPELEAAVGKYLGFRAGANYGEQAWSTRQQADITDCVNSGLRKFYFCKYDWSFMRPIRSILLESGASSAPMPDDFGGIEGQVRLIDSGKAGIAIPITNEQRIGQMFFERPDQTGQPTWCAVRWNMAAGERSSRANLYVFPAADQAYTLSVQYYFSPDKLTTSFPYAHGGSVHAETIMAACLAAAEIYKDNQKGPMDQNFQECLDRSMDLDRRNKAQTLGYVGDPSYNQGQWPVGWRHYQQGQLATWDT